MADAAKKGVQVRYTGQADVRKINKADFATVDLDHDAVKFDRAGGFVQEVSEPVADWLVANDNFELVKDEPKA